MSFVLMIFLHFAEELFYHCARVWCYQDVIVMWCGHGAGDGRTRSSERWWSRTTLCNSQDSEEGRCIYMQVVLWLQTCQSLSDKVHIFAGVSIKPLLLTPSLCSCFSHSLRGHSPKHNDVTVSLTDVTLLYFFSLKQEESILGKKGSEKEWGKRALQ